MGEGEDADRPTALRVRGPDQERDVASQRRAARGHRRDIERRYAVGHRSRDRMAGVLDRLDEALEGGADDADGRAELEPTGRARDEDRGRLDAGKRDRLDTEATEPFGTGVRHGQSGPGTGMSLAGRRCSGGATGNASPSSPEPVHRSETGRISHQPMSIVTSRLRTATW